VTYAYDAYGRFAAVSSAVGSASSVANYAYVPGARLVAGYTIGGLTRSVSYEPQRDLIASVTNAWNSALISSFDYVNDEIGRRTARTDNGSVANQFAYNVRSEVATAIMGTNTYGYVFDSIGNRIVSTNNAEISTYVANELNQYTAISNEIVTLPVHDDDGNMLTNGVWSYTWDGENRLIGVSSNGAALATYAYDFASRRVAKAANDGSKSYIYDGWNLIREANGTNFTCYVWGLDIFGSLQLAGGVGGLLSVVYEGSIYHPAFDANGNATEYSDVSGKISAQYMYSPFGETAMQAGDFPDAFVFRFSTKYWENEVGLCY
jgi:YD repeat-containing protein